jgi:hypothetical protein
MKPNLLVVQAADLEIDSLIEHFCEALSDSHYVYLVRPASGFREDSPGGVRFLNHSLDRLPRFGAVDTAIAIADPQVVKRLKEVYPDSKLAVWDPRENCNLPLALASHLRGEFAQAV